MDGKSDRCLWKPKTAVQRWNRLDAIVIEVVIKRRRLRKVKGPEHAAMAITGVSVMLGWVATSLSPI